MNRVKYLLKGVNNISIKNKLLISYILVVLLPVLIVGLRLTVGMRQMALEQAIQQTTSNVDRIKKRMSETVKVPIDLANKFYSDKKLQDTVSRRYESAWEVVEAYWAYPDLTDYVRLYSELSNIRFYTENPTLLDNWSFLKSNPDVKESKWYKSALGNKGKISWDYITDETKGNQYYLSLVRDIRSYLNQSLGVLVIGINNNYLNSILSEEPFETMIVLNDGFIVASKNTNLVGQNIKTLDLNLNLKDMGRKILKLNYKNKPSEVIIDGYLQNSDGEDTFKIISVFPIEAITGEANRISGFGFYVMFISLILAIGMILVFSKTLGSRVRKLSVQMHKVALGNFKVSTTIEGEDEIGQLFRDMNMMVKSIEGLMSEVNEANYQKNQLIIKQKEIKLKMLANQINPHFLFNALETIRMKAHCQGAEEISETVQMLGKLMRNYLEVGSEPVRVASEIDTVKSYLEIQKFRYGDRINYTIEIDEECRNCRILPLTIQPIVENAVIHGLEGKEDTGNIHINIHKENSILHISITDDGLGMNEPSLQRLLQSLNEMDNDTGKRIGLRNVHQRIKLYYGLEYGLAISSKENFGTRIDILLPAEEFRDA